MMPSGIFAELIEARDSDQQLAQYAAVAMGLRRSLDDWVSAERFERFQSLASRLGLLLEVDCIFEPLSKDARVVGSEYSPTTRASALPYRGRATSGSRLHIVVSSRPEWVADALASSWYSVAVHGAVLRKPLIDHARFGRALGYPECCVEFFLKHNDWGRQNTLAEAARRSRSFRWETNCLTKLTPWMLSFHMPCAFDCPETINYGQEVLEAVRKWDASFADEILSFMRRPCLALSERFACAFTGVASGERCEYTALQDLCADAPNRHQDDEERAATLARGNALNIVDATVFVYRNAVFLESFEAKAGTDLIEVPLILPFT